MKKSFKLFAAALMALAMFVPAQANETLTVCEGTNSSMYVPFRNIDFQDQGMHTQFIYPAEMVEAMNGQQINSVTFFLNGDGLYAKDGQLVIKMGETDNPRYSTARDFREGLTEVASISLTEGVTELTIEFTAPYTYNGGNLVIDCYAAEGGDTNYYGWNSWRGLNQSSYCAIGSDASMATFLPMATFDYGVPAEWAAKVTPTEVTFKTIRAERQDVQTIVLRNNGLNAFTPVFGALEAPFSIDVEAVELASAQEMEIPVVFAPMAEGEYNATLTIDCGEAGELEVVLMGTALEAANEITVCDNTALNSYIPVYGLYYDSNKTNAQMIYPAEMLKDLVGKEITSVAFYSSKPVAIENGMLQLSFKMTDQTEFAEAEEITDLTVVATLVPDPASDMLVFNLETPFMYTGGNLAIEDRVITAGTWKGTSFYGEGQSYNASLYTFDNWGVESRVQSFLPKATFLYKDGGEQPQVIKGDVDGNGEVSIADVTALIDILVGGGDAPAAADCNDDTEVGIADVTVLIDFLLSGQW